MYLITIG